MPNTREGPSKKAIQLVVKKKYYKWVTIPFLVQFVVMSRVVNNNSGFLQLLADCPAYLRHFCFKDSFSTTTTCTSRSLILWVPSGKSQRGEFVYLFEKCAYSDLRDIFLFHNFRGLKWIPLQNRMAPNFKTTTLAHCRLSPLSIKQ